MPAGTVMGHVHLHVGDIARAAAFFSDAIGFDRTVWHYPGALFLAAGGYHHHLGTNTWAGRGAAAPAADDARLLEWTVHLPDARSLDALAESVAKAGFPAERGPGADGLVARDPWGTHVRFVAAGESG
jgi:catechol 2,3-dioxygenase